MNDLFEQQTLSFERIYPEWIFDNPIHQACVLSDRIIAAEMGKDWDWQGLTVADFPGGMSINIRNHYPIVYNACIWLDKHNEPCIQSNICYIADEMGKEQGLTGLPSRIRYMHRISRYIDDLWAKLTLDKYDHIKAVKEATRRRKLIQSAYEVIEGVLDFRDVDQWLRDLGELESLRSRVEKVDWV